MSSKETGAAPAAGAPKHRACDECRSRKLACTKEPDGCSRCRREGIVCHYSPQKPMGRPRKRRQVEEPDDVDAHAEDVMVRRATVSPEVSSAGQSSGGRVNATVGVGTGLGDGGNEMTMPALGIQDVSSSAFYAPDPSLAFLQETPSSNFDFLDVLPQDYADGQPQIDQQQSLQNLDPQIYLPSDGAAQHSRNPYSADGGLSLLDGLDFNEPDPTAADLSKDLSGAIWTYWSKHNGPPVEPAESSYSDTSNSVNSPESSHDLSATSSRTPSDPKPIPIANCGCLSSLYLALDSLSRLPPDVLGAMRLARHATKIAHDVIKCNVCSNPVLDDCSKPPPIQAFQNTMCLAALVPSACNAYATILEMVDTETAAAKREGRTIWFAFKDIGGLWHAIGENHGHCPRMQAYNNRFMDPDQWRITIRAVLRLDVDGLGEPCGDVHAPGYNHYGLRDVVRLLDERSERRHRKMDELSLNGSLKMSHNALFPGPYKPVPHHQRNCVQILEAARVALDNLVIS